MPQIRNTAGYDLEVAGRVYPAGQAVDVDDREADYLSRNPNFTAVETAEEPPPATVEADALEKAHRARKKA